MSHDQRVCLGHAVNGFRASPSSYYGVGTAGTNPAEKGPAGSASMTFFCVAVPSLGPTGLRGYFNRTSFVAAGWGCYRSSTLLAVNAYNATPAGVAVTIAATSLEGYGVPYLMLASFQQPAGVATMTFWANGILAGSTALGAGYTSLSNRPTVIGVSSNTPASYATDDQIGDCGMLDGYDVGTYVDPVFGNGGPGLSARWLADLREGRYLTWPRPAVAGQDWHWSAQDCVKGMGCAPAWVDRYSAISMLKFGQPQGSSFNTRRG